MKNIANAQVCVGILSAESISFCLNNSFLFEKQEVVGEQHLVLQDEKIYWKGSFYDKLCFEPQTKQASFTLKNVIIGIDFHWERKENQTFLGCLRVVIHDKKLLVINTLDIDTYLESVISSEMSATSSIELLKAHAIISRSWLLAQIIKREGIKSEEERFNSFIINTNERIKWYDREDHTLFDLCSDDHCQRYQGITKETTKYVKEAVQSTSGLVLAYKDEICDARFSKCCGGVTEEYKYCWEDMNKPYLQSMTDSANSLSLDLTQEANVNSWISAHTNAFCNTKDVKVLTQILNDYDQETTTFYRWQVKYTQEELQNLLSENLNLSIGCIKDLIALERGKSGRIAKLQIVGEKDRFILGKELEIRRVLSKSHLYSSAFIVQKETIENDIPQTFILKGAGWGHGVGLCQIGAAVMAHKGYDYKDILLHYYKGVTIEQVYKK